MRLHSATSVTNPCGAAAVTDWVRPASTPQHTTCTRAGTRPVHAASQSGGPTSSQEDNQAIDDDDGNDGVDQVEDDVDQVEDDEDVEFPEPGQDDDQWTDDEQLLTHGPMLNTGKVAWYALVIGGCLLVSSQRGHRGEIALTIARDILEGSKGLLALYALTADPSRKRLSIRLDKVADMLM